MLMGAAAQHLSGSNGNEFEGLTYMQRVLPAALTMEHTHHVLVCTEYLWT